MALRYIALNGGREPTSQITRPLLQSLEGLRYLSR